MRDSLLFLRLFIISLSVMLAACSVPIKVVSPPISVPKSFSQSGKRVLQDKWWQEFNDPHLNQLINQALSDNLDLKGMFNRLEQARAVAQQRGSQRIPSVDVLAGVSSTVNESQSTGRTTTDQVSLGLSASYEVDLWGRVSATINTADLDVLATREDYLTAEISLAAEVASVWYQLIEQRRQVLLLNEQVKTNEHSLEIVTFQFKGGQATASDVLQQRQSVEAAKGGRLTAESNVKVLEHQLAILIGMSPESDIIPVTTELPEYKPLPDTGLTSDLIQRRPDIRSAYYSVQAADRRVAIAIADQFPRVSLTATADTTATNVNDLFKNWVANLSANLVGPIIDGGRRAAEVERTKAVYSERVNNYGQIILLSIKEVEDAIIQETQQKKLLTNLKKQLELSKQATNQIRTRYIYGAVDFLRFLTTELNHQTLQRNQLRAELELIKFRINLYRALAGGWEDAIPSEVQVRNTINQGS